MSNYIIAKKLNMSQVFKDDGTVVPVTWVELKEKSTDLEPGKEIVVTGKSKGKGFAGVMKRHGFSGGPATHGQSDRERAPGSIGGTTDPAKVIKGKKMPGRMGGKKVTLKSKEIVKMEDKKVAVHGPVPGAYGSKLKLKLREE